MRLKCSCISSSKGGEINKNKPEKRVQSGVMKCAGLRLFSGDEKGYLTLLEMFMDDSYGKPMLSGRFKCKACGRRLCNYSSNAYAVTPSCGCMRIEANVTHGMTRGGHTAEELIMFRAAKDATNGKRKVP